MRKRFLAPVLAFVILFCISQVAWASFVNYSGAWETTDTQSSAYTISLFGDLSTGWSFGVYDIGDDTNPSALTLINSANTFSTFYIDSSNSLNVTQGMSSGSSFSLTSSSGYFGFYFSDSSTNYYTYEFDSAGPVNQWLLKMASDYSAGGPVIASDVNPVPIPGAVWLLGSGLIGIVGIRRKFSSKFG